MSVRIHGFSILRNSRKCSHHNNIVPLRIAGFSVPRTRFLALVDARSQTAYKFLLFIFAFRKCDIAHPKGPLGLHVSFFTLSQVLWNHLSPVQPTSLWVHSLAHCTPQAFELPCIRAFQSSEAGIPRQPLRRQVLFNKTYLFLHEICKL